jgi:hypothetical protein
LLPNLTQCHGMAGLGEALLEGWRVAGDKRWLAESKRIDGLLEAMPVEVSGGLAWMAENLHRPTADLMVGGGGVLHFLLRLDNPYALWPPLLPPLDMLAGGTTRRQAGPPRPPSSEAVLAPGYKATSGRSIRFVQPLTLVMILAGLLVIRCRGNDR